MVKADKVVFGFLGVGFVIVLISFILCCIWWARGSDDESGKNAKDGMVYMGVIMMFFLIAYLPASAIAYFQLKNNSGAGALGEIAKQFL